MPQDLAILARGLAERGISVRLPAPDGRHEVPEPLEVDADLLSATVIQLRGGR